MEKDKDARSVWCGVWHLSQPSKDAKYNHSTRPLRRQQYIEKWIPTFFYLEWIGFMHPPDVPESVLDSLWAGFGGGRAADVDGPEAWNRGSCWSSTPPEYDEGRCIYIISRVILEGRCVHPSGPVDSSHQAPSGDESIMHATLWCVNCCPSSAGALLKG
uniref:Uncharacterized protein n=1 Tax=Eutreptiella gymnastica TaxID=73025 RepID=A0A6U8GL99_9EUGL|mmetsp:Transcript_49383/g.88225  ORF Transcript_49383/g.88225 Transcript_49383/m.88225 type:complete len:159 (+) Transcript_49383:85-561(+)